MGRTDQILLCINRLISREMLMIAYFIYINLTLFNIKFNNINI